MRKINSLYVSILVCFQLINSFLCFSVYNNFQYNGEDAWISIIVMSILGLISLFFFFKLANYEEELSIIDKNKKLYGNILGNIINIIVVILFFLIGVLFLYNISDFISSQYLYKTPNIVISILLSLVCFINVCRGFGTMTKSGLLLFVWSISLFIFSAIALTYKVDISNFYPILKNGIKNPFMEGIIMFINNILPIYLFLLIPLDDIRDRDKYKRNILIAYLFSVTIMFVTVFITLGISGIYLSKIYQYPEYMVLKNISLFTSIERVENILSMQWVIYAFMALSMIIYYISSNIKIKEKINNYVTFIITIVICIISRYIFTNNAIANSFTHNILPFILSTFLLIYLISGILIIIKKKNML